MRSGRDILREIDAAVAEASADVERVGSRLRAASARRREAKEGEAEGRERFVAARWTDLEARRTPVGDDPRESEVVVLLDRRDAERARLVAEQASVDAERVVHDGVRTERRVALDVARAARDARIAEVRARLAREERWQVLDERASRAVATAQHADAKADRAEADRVEKGRPYERTKLFMYLWRRRYRFPEYRAGRIARWLDGWVARTCGYERAHRDYAMLLELPVRLRAHAESAAAVADEAVEARVALEADELAKAGLGALDAAVAGAQRELDAAEVAVSTDEERLERLRAAVAQVDARNDRLSHEAAVLLRGIVRDADVAALGAVAAASPTPADDAAVAAVAAHRAEAERVDAELERLRAEQSAALRRAADVEALRRRFRREEFDADESEFESDLGARSILDELAVGNLDVGEAFGRFSRRQRFRSPPADDDASWGGVSFGRRSSSRSAGMSVSRAFGGSSSGGSSHSSFGGGGGSFGGSGGGMRTGGGIGGGGMRTGGGF